VVFWFFFSRDRRAPAQPLAYAGRQPLGKRLVCRCLLSRHALAG